MNRIAAALALLLTATSASAQPILPPAKYDKPYTGFLMLYRDLDEARMLENCPSAPPAGLPRLGCANRWPDGRTCEVFLADDKTIRAAGFDPAIILRHEIGHCHGWGADHAGGRFVVDVEHLRPPPKVVRRPFDRIKGIYPLAD